MQVYVCKLLHIGTRCELFDYKINKKVIKVQIKLKRIINKYISNSTIKLYK